MFHLRKTLIACDAVFRAYNGNCDWYRASVNALLNSPSIAFTFLP